MEYTQGEWKLEHVNTGSGKWIRIFVDDENYEDGKELFESGTVQINTARNTLKRRWKDTKEASEIRANAALVIAAPKMLRALKAVQALLPEDVQGKVEALILEAETPQVPR